jgi:hypothetical protein
MAPLKYINYARFRPEVLRKYWGRLDLTGLKFEPRICLIPKNALCEKMEKESIGERGMGARYKGSQGQTKRTVELHEEEEDMPNSEDCLPIPA